MTLECVIRVVIGAGGVDRGRHHTDFGWSIFHSQKQIYDFDDPDDFADEWAEEFGDGDFEDGWDDA